MSTNSLAARRIPLVATIRAAARRFGDPALGLGAALTLAGHPIASPPHSGEAWVVASALGMLGVGLMGVGTMARSIGVATMMRPVVALPAALIGGAGLLVAATPVAWTFEVDGHFALFALAALSMLVLAVGAGGGPARVRAAFVVSGVSALALYVTLTAGIAPTGPELAAIGLVAGPVALLTFAEAGSEAR